MPLENHSVDTLVISLVWDALLSSVMLLPLPSPTPIPIALAVEVYPKTSSFKQQHLQCSVKDIVHVLGWALMQAPALLEKQLWHVMMVQSKVHICLCFYPNSVSQDAVMKVWFSSKAYESLTYTSN